MKLRVLRSRATASERAMVRATAGQQRKTRRVILILLITGMVVVAFSQRARALGFNLFVYCTHMTHFKLL